jgi:hypothetical protein
MRVGKEKHEGLICVCFAGFICPQFAVASVRILSSLAVG